MQLIKSLFTRRSALAAGAGLFASYLVALGCRRTRQPLQLADVPADHVVLRFYETYEGVPHHVLFEEPVDYYSVRITADYVFIEVRKPKSTFETDLFFNTVIYDMTYGNYELHVSSSKDTIVMEGPVAYCGFSEERNTVKLVSRKCRVNTNEPGVEETVALQCYPRGGWQVPQYAS